MPIGHDLLERTALRLGQLDATAISDAANLIYRTHTQGGVTISCGNGGSASTASHFVADLAKLTIVPGRPRAKTICFNDNVSALTAWTNDADFASVYAEQAEPWISSDSSVVLFSVHGGSRDASVSANLPRIAEMARDRGAALIAVTGFDGGRLADLADVHINVPEYDEPLATPLIESLHVLVHHAVCVAVRELIEQEQS
ncbi:hypothetical protein CH275_16475 [Rhodococcus sp. 06-235-1A]|uniref:SIS domain-containing protein n=1 Tax=Rhodococcus sp. 06-235-1A TaxID=2022508 RepID=UPI000B9AE780|nr:SIS domain-containing protein [Rhodococcus sp. 06-235-1A]OZD03373.1 hypothetical protein CH275_16475 [Rhodococcus sp. 06-235-1A]